MSGSTLILGVSSVPLIQNPYINAGKPLVDGRDGTSDPELTQIIYTAKWAVSISLSIAVTCQSGIALLSRSLDPKGSLKISNRYVRLLPRLLVVAVVTCLPIDRNMPGATFLFIIVLALFGSLIWEWFVSLERGGGFLEP